ncbi:MAG: helix-turn-helix transcriptional regulator [Clostridia bacterium]|nr:helix-turn-helix transcriptional regulator [Clostridia bacterium]
MIKERLKELRKEKELTQKELSKLVNLSSNCVCEWEKGRSQPNVETLKKLSEIFSCSVDYIIGNTDDFGNIVPAQPLKEGEKQLLEIFRSLAPIKQSQLSDYAKFLAQEKK